MRRTGMEEARVTFTELFFDLIYVFCVTQISHFLLSNLTLLGMAQSLVLWFGVWLGWQYICWFTNWFDPEAMPVRLMLFVVMAFGLVAAASLPHAFESGGHAFAWSFSCAQIIRALFMYQGFRVSGAPRTLVVNSLRILIWSAGSAFFWILGANATPENRLLFWVAAISAEYFSPMIGYWVPKLGRSYSKEWVIDGPHLAERCQLFVIVALGESLLMTGSSLAHHEHWDIPTLIGFAVFFLTALALWWIYFDTSSKDGSRAIHHSEDPGRIGAYFGYLHVLLVGAIIVFAVASELVLAEPAKRMETVDVAALMTGPIVYLGANAFYKWVVYRAVPRSHWLGLTAFLLLVPFAYWTDRLMVAGLTMLVLGGIAIYDGLRARS